jgi:hypothetical protein
MITMRVIAEFGTYRLEQDLNGGIVMFHGPTMLVYDSAIEAIRAVKDPAVRAELVKLWEADLARQRYSERQTREVQK